MSDDNDSQDAGNDEEQNENMKTVLYSFTREALRPEDLREIRDALQESGFEISKGEESGNLLIQRPAETGSGVDVDSILGE